jgi:hypothetical protein
MAFRKSSRIAAGRGGTRGTLSHPTAARSGLAQFLAVSITNTGGKGSRRKGKEELSGHSALIASPQFLVAIRVRLPVHFVCNETHELGEELVGSSRYQVHILHWLESNNYGVFLSDNDLYRIGQTSKLDGIIAQHRFTPVLSVQLQSISRGWSHRMFPR